MAKILKDLVALGRDSKTGGANERAEYLAPRLKKAGFDVELDRVMLRDEGKKVAARNLVAVREVKGAPTIFLYSHLDTVGAAPGWSTDPYGLVEKGRKLYGLGALDMLSGVTAFVEALQAKARYGVILLGACEEEGGGAGVEHFAARRKGLLARADIILSGDATDIFKRNSGPGQHPHSILMGNPAYGCAGVTVTPKKSDTNPLEVLDIVMKEVKRLVSGFKDRSESPLMRDRAVLCDVKTDSPDWAYFPAQATVQMDVVLGHPATMERLEAVRAELERQLLSRPAIRRISKRFDVKVGFGDDPFPPLCGFFSADLSNPLLASLTGTIKEVVGVRNVRRVGGEYPGDENILANALAGMGKEIPIIGYTAAGGNEHGANEYVCASSFEQVKEVYRKLLAQ